MNEISRRNFFNTIVGAAVATQCGGFLAGCAKSSTGSGTALTPDATGKVTLTFAEYPDLQSSNGAYQIRVQTTRALKVINVTNISNVISAYSAVCPHEGSLVDKWSGTNFTCPSHGSTFNGSGAVTAGPATTNLTSFTTSTSATGIEIQVT